MSNYVLSNNLSSNVTPLASNDGVYGSLSFIESD